MSLQLRDFLHTEFDAVEPPAKVFYRVLCAIEARQKGGGPHLLYDLGQRTYRPLAIHMKLAATLILAILTTSAVQPFLRANTVSHHSAQFVATPHMDLTEPAFGNEQNKSDDPRLEWLILDNVQDTSMYNQDEFRQSRLGQCTEQRRCRKTAHPEYRVRGSGF